MAKINTYDLDNLPDLLDFLLGSKKKNGKTMNFSLQSIINLINGVNGKNVIQYKFFNETTPDIDYTTPGAFFTNNNQTDVNNFSSLLFNKKTLGNYDLTVLFDFLSGVGDLFIGIDNPSNPNNFFTLKVTSISNQGDYFIFNVEPYNGLYIGELSHESIYSLYWETKEWISQIDDINSDLDSKLDHGGYTGTGQDLKNEIDAVATDLADNYYTKPEVDGKISSVYRFRGNVANFAALPTVGLTIGDVYNALDTDINWAWTGTIWDNLGGTSDISGKEDKSNKQNSLVPDGTGQKYLTVDAANTGLNLKLDKGTYTGNAGDLKADIDAIFVPDQLISAVPPTRSVNTFTYPSVGYTALISKTLRTNPAQFITTIAAASTSNHKRVDLIYFKSDNTLAKIIGTEDLIVAPRPDVPNGSVGVSFINVFGSVIDTPTPITQEISVQNSLGVEQFSISDYFRVRGASFSSSLKQISIDAIVPFTAFVDGINGNDSIAELENSSKPYKTIDAVFAGLTNDVDRQIIVQIVKRGNYPINNRLPAGQTIIRSTLNVTIDLSTNENQYLFLTYNDGNLDGSSLTFDIPNGALQNLRAGGTGVSIAQAQTNYVINLRSIYWDSISYIFYGDNAIIQKLDNLNTKGAFSNQLLVRNGFKTNILTIPSGAFETVLSGIGGTVEISSLVLNVGNIQFTGDVYYKIGNITGTGVLNFTYQGGNTIIEFAESVIVPQIRISQSLGNLTFTGSIKSCSIDDLPQINNGVLNFKNLIIDNVTSGHFLNFGNLVFNIINTTIKIQSYLIHKTQGDSISVNIVNSTIEQVTPTYLVRTNSPSIINLKIGGLETNAISLGNTKDVIVTYDLLSFKDKINEIVVRSKVDIINKTLDSNMTYLIDGVLTLLTGEYIEVPAGGLTINGYGFNPSSIRKNVSGQSIFTSPALGSGDFVSINISYYPGVGKVFQIKDATGGHAIELDKVNFEGVSGSSLGVFEGYRQFTGTTCGFYFLSDGIILEGTWSGFKLTNSNVIGFGASGTLFKKGISTTFSNRFYIDLNLQIATGSIICDFLESNFSNNESLQVVNCYNKVAGAIDDTTTGVTFPNITPYSPKSYFSGNKGIKNSNIVPYGINAGKLLSYADDTAASAGGIVAVGDTYIESSTGYFKKRLT